MKFLNRRDDNLHDTMTTKTTELTGSRTPAIPTLGP